MAENDTDPALDGLLEYVRETRGVDLSAYKPTTLKRRIGKRLQTLGMEDLSSYRERLEGDPDEFARLFDTILINVTSFFRDAETWDHLAAEEIPRVIEDKPPDAHIRVWNAACSSGEETCTLAMLLAEALGIDAFRRRVKIYATDVDEGALAQARQASFTPEQVEPLPEELRDRYLRRDDTGYALRSDLRGVIVFGRHDLLRDAPMSRIDILTCRNTLMYFNPDAQAGILARLHFALNPDGILLLGRSEMLLTHTDLFRARNLRYRVFEKIPGSPKTAEPLIEAARNTRNGATPNELVRARDVAFDASPIPQLLIDADRNLALANEQARELFGILPDDLGRPFQDLEIAYRPAELRTAIDRSYAERGPILLSDVEWHLPGGDARTLEIRVDAVVGDRGHMTGAIVTFEDVSTQRHLGQELERLRQERETAYEELHASNEELETTNEELQSTVEELETTNEELQSSNEELETMNEELQSTNTELETINQELQQRGAEYDRVNTFLESILSSIRAGVVVVDTELRVLIWNPQAEELWGVRADEARERTIADIDINLPVDRLIEPLRAVVAGRSTQYEDTFEVVDRRGRPMACRVVCTPLRGTSSPRGAILFMEDVTADGG